MEQMTFHKHLEKFQKIHVSGKDLENHVTIKYLIDLFHILKKFKETNEKKASWEKTFSVTLKP